MSLPIRPGEELAAAAPSRLVADWLRETEAPRSATGELGLVEGLAAAAAPWFRRGGPESWVATMHEELPGEDRERFDEDRAALARGRARVVVTGQQPGFAGGPLLTIYKIATAVALARRESAAGRPTVPVFWLGDDDDDVREACEAVLWDPADGSLTGSELAAAARGGILPRRRLSSFVLPEGQAALGAWLERLAEAGDDLLLHGVWSEAVARGRGWSEFLRRALLRVFSGSGLMIVNGDDDSLHGAAAPFYDVLGPRLEELATAVKRRGGELTAQGWHAQIGPRSLERPLFRVRGQGRAAVGGEAGNPPAEELRPGVMLRSPVQDWLLEPAAVIVGPGEMAYLRQLDPVYKALGVRRSPLVPRLSAWLLPPGFDRALLAARDRVGRDQGSDGPPWLEAWLATATSELGGLLREQLDLTPERALDLAGGRVRRWRRGLVSMVAGEARRKTRAGLWPGPSWVLPEGVRQERRLAWYGALALWGRELRNGVLVAAGMHLAGGAEGVWRQFEITVEEPEETHER